MHPKFAVSSASLPPGFLFPNRSCGSIFEFRHVGLCFSFVFCLSSFVPPSCPSLLLLLLHPSFSSSSSKGTKMPIFKMPYLLQMGDTVDRSRADVKQQLCKYVHLNVILKNDYASEWSRIRTHRELWVKSIFLLSTSQFQWKHECENSLCELSPHTDTHNRSAESQSWPSLPPCGPTEQ